ncbi:MAG: hypothetical protein IT204_04875 [Fimbriimonadaceae bacterium]|nr:hypothetical protein [Fimbriimonadaceae bacterium]
MMPLLWLLLLADTATPIAPGQAVYRPRATVSQRPGPDGTRQAVQADFYSLELAAPEPLRISLQTAGRHGVVVKALEQVDAAGQPRTVGLVGPARPLAQHFVAGRYLLVVATDPPSSGGYLLSVARPPQPAGELQVLPTPAGQPLGVFGRWQLGHPVRGEVCWRPPLLLSRDARGGWLDDLPSKLALRLPQAPGELQRVALSPDGWSCLTVTPQGAVALSLPDLTPFLKIGAPGGVRDACFAGRHQRVAVLPREGNLFIGSPVAGDLAHLAGSAGAQRLFAGGDGLATLTADTVTLFDAADRTLVGSHAATADEVVVSPITPALVLLQPTATRLLEVGAQCVEQELPAARAAAWSVHGDLALAGQTAVLWRREQEIVALQPAVTAAAVTFDPAGRQLAAVTAAGEVTIWDLPEVEAPDGPAATPLNDSRRAYAEGLRLYQEKQYAAAWEQFAASRKLLAAAGAGAEVRQFTCLALFRMSLTSYVLEAWERSLAEAEELLTAVRVLPAGEFRSYNLAMALYRRADALWELQRRAEAKEGYQQALDAGLSGPAADDAKQKVAGP